MLTSLLLALSIGGALPMQQGLLLALVWQNPAVASLPVLGGCAYALRQKRRAYRGGSVAAFHRTVAAELQAGRSLRLSLAGACRSVTELGLVRVARLAEAGRPLEEVAAILSMDQRLLPAATAVRVAGMTGGSVAVVFDALTAEAVDDEALRLEQRALTVQARLSVTIVGGFPLIVLAGQLFGGELSRLVARGPVGAAMVAIGVSLLSSGLLVVVWLIRAARQ
jgi:Flp pilus assembly protein TadB